MKSLLSKRKVITLKLRNSILVLISTFVFTESASGKDCNKLISELIAGGDVSCVIAGYYGAADFRGSMTQTDTSARFRGAANSKVADFIGDVWIDKNSNTILDFDGTFTYKPEHPYFAAGLVSKKSQTRNSKEYGKVRWEFENGALLVGNFKEGLFDGKIDLTLSNQIKITGQFDDGKPHGYATLTKLTNDKSISIKSMPFSSIWHDLGYAYCSDYCYPRGAYDGNTEAQLTSYLWNLAENRIALEQESARLEREEAAARIREQERQKALKIARAKEAAEKRRKALLAMKPVTCEELITAINANEVRARRDYPQDQIRIKGIATDINVTSRGYGNEVAVVKIQEREDFLNGCSAYMHSFDEAIYLDKNQRFDFVCNTWNESMGNVAFENCRLMKNAIK